MTLPKGLGDYDAGYVERGVASWYGGYFHGRPTASGVIYDQFKMTAAHRMLPLGTVVRVTNPDNGRSVVVVINDRGPYIRGRILDLSFAAAQQLGAVEPGTLPVLIETVQMDRASLSRLTGQDERGLNPPIWEDPSSPLEAPTRLAMIESRNRGPMDLLRDSRRTRRVMDAGELSDEQLDHDEFIEELIEMEEAVA